MKYSLMNLVSYFQKSYIDVGYFPEVTDNDDDDDFDDDYH